MTKDQSAKIPNKHRPLWRSWLLCLALPGCRSAPPPAPPPPAVSMAERAEQQALKISSQDQNWPAAARAWQLAADRYALLNDVPRQAMALHNLAQAERQTGQIAKAGENLEQASKLNEHIGNTNQWWRNQIALLQIEAESKQIDQLKSRFEKLLPLAAQIRDRSITGLFLNELALWQ